MARQLKPKPTYSCSLIDEGKQIYAVTKYAPDLEGDYEEEAVYKVEHDSEQKRYTCECFAGLMGKYCRHKQVVDIFKANPEKIGSIHYWNFDRKCWAAN
jgi:hypothetical protein